MQEHSGDIPAGSMPRSIDVILRHEVVDAAKPGDRCVFAGTLLAVPEVVSMLKPGEKQQVAKKTEGRRGAEGKNMDGITGLKQLGVRDLSYKLVFIASSVHSSDSKMGFRSLRDIFGEDSEEAAKNFT